MKQKLIFYLNLKIRYLTANAAHNNQGARPNRKYGKYLRLLTFRGRTPPPLMVLFADILILSFLLQLNNIYMKRISHLVHNNNILFYFF